MSKGNHKKGKGKGKHHRGLGALDTMKKEAANPGMYFLGFLTSALIAKAVDKALPVVQDGDGKFKAKALIKPALLIGAGGACVFFGSKKEYIRYFGYGMATGGVVSATKVILKKDIFGGLGEMFDDQLEAMMQNIRQNPQWLAAVQTKATTNGNSLDEQIRLDAMWMLEQKGTSGVGRAMPLQRRVLDADIFRETADTQRQLLRQNSYDPEFNDLNNAVNGLGANAGDDDILLGLDKTEEADYQILGLDSPEINEDIL
jgi:hypothetical protein